MLRLIRTARAAVSRISRKRRSRSLSSYAPAVQGSVVTSICIG